MQISIIPIRQMRLRRQPHCHQPTTAVIISTTRTTVGTTLSTTTGQNENVSYRVSWPFCNGRMDPSHFPYCYCPYRSTITTHRPEQVRPQRILPRRTWSTLQQQEQRHHHRNHWYHYCYRYWIPLRYSFEAIGTFIPNLWKLYHIPPSSVRIDNNDNPHRPRRPWSLSDRIPIINNSCINNCNKGYGPLRCYYCIYMVKYTNHDSCGPTSTVQQRRRHCWMPPPMIHSHRMTRITSCSPLYCIKLPNQPKMGIGWVRSRMMYPFHNCTPTPWPVYILSFGINNKRYDFQTNYGTMTQLTTSKKAIEDIWHR